MENYCSSLCTVYSKLQCLGIPQTESQKNPSLTLHVKVQKNHWTFPKVKSRISKNCFVFTPSYYPQCLFDGALRNSKISRADPQKRPADPFRNRVEKYPANKPSYRSSSPGWSHFRSCAFRHFNYRTLRKHCVTARSDRFGPRPSSYASLTLCADLATPELILFFQLVFAKTTP